MTADRPPGCRLVLGWAGLVAAESLALQAEGIDGERAFKQALSLYRDPNAPQPSERIPGRKHVWAGFARVAALTERVMAYLAGTTEPRTAKEIAATLAAEAKYVRYVLSKLPKVDLTEPFETRQVPARGTLVLTGYRGHRQGGRRETLWWCAR